MCLLLWNTFIVTIHSNPFACAIVCASNCSPVLRVLKLLFFCCNCLTCWTVLLLCCLLTENIVLLLLLQSPNQRFSSYLCSHLVNPLRLYWSSCWVTETLNPYHDYEKSLIISLLCRYSSHISYHWSPKCSRDLLVTSNLRNIFMFEKDRSLMNTKVSMFSPRANWVKISSCSSRVMRHRTNEKVFKFAVAYHHHFNWRVKLNESIHYSWKQCFELYKTKMEEWTFFKWWL
jgi:hypothetical protein